MITNGQECAQGARAKEPERSLRKVPTTSIRHAWGFGEAVCRGRGGLGINYFYRQNHIFEANKI